MMERLIYDSVPVLTIKNDQDIILKVITTAICSSERRRAIPAITEKLLIEHHKQLKADKIVSAGQNLLSLLSFTIS